MMWTTAAQTALIGAFVGISTGFAIIPKPETPRVDLISVEFAAPDLLVYTREVPGDKVVLAEYARRILVADTDETVSECVVRGETDYGPLEPKIQSFQLNSECKAAMIEGVEYKVFALVAPFTGPADSIVSKPFVWGQ